MCRNSLLTPGRFIVVAGGFINLYLDHDCEVNVSGRAIPEIKNELID